MDPMSIAIAATKLGLGFLKSKGKKRQADNMAIQAGIDEAFTKGNVWQTAARGLGDALVASRRAGGHAPGALSGGFNGLAADLRTAQFNALQQRSAAQTARSAASLSLLGSGIDAALGLYGDYRSGKKKRIQGGAGE
jgi:hypothetical protein